MILDVGPPNFNFVPTPLFFTVNILDSSKDVCSLCNTAVSRGGKDSKSYNTTCLRHHLQTNHKAEHKELETIEAEMKHQGKQMTLNESIEMSKSLILFYTRRVGKPSGPTSSD